MNKRFLIVATLAFFAFSLAPLVLAQTPPAGSGNTNPPAGSGNPASSGVTLINPLQGSCTPGSNDCLMNFLQSILTFVVRIGAIAVVLMLVFVGFKFVAARGSSKEIEDARRMLLYTVIGALILLGAQAISLGIQATVQAIH